MSFDRYSEKLGYEAGLKAAAKVTLTAYQSLKKAAKSTAWGKRISNSKSHKIGVVRNERSRSLSREDQGGRRQVP